jgi:hypothetical protein
LDRTRAQNNIQNKEQQRAIEEVAAKLDRARRDLADSEKDRAAERKQFEEFRKDTA